LSPSAYVPRNVWLVAPISRIRAFLSDGIVDRGPPRPAAPLRALNPCRVHRPGDLDYVGGRFGRRDWQARRDYMGAGLD
jgi:hypothetical protein